MAAAPAPHAAAAAGSKPEEPLVTCPHCNRTFTADALSRHKPICGHSGLKHRRPFDSFKQRAEGTELKNYRPSKSAPSLRGAAAHGGIGSGKSSSNWRQQHEELIGAVRNARLTKRAMETGGPLPPPPPPSANPDYIQCPYCGRRFNEAAAARHIPFCKEKNERLPPMKTSTKPLQPPPPSRPPLASRASTVGKGGSGGGAAGAAGGAGGAGGATGPKPGARSTMGPGQTRR